MQRLLNMVGERYVLAQWRAFVNTVMIMRAPKEDTMDWFAFAIKFRARSLHRVSSCYVVAGQPIKMWGATAQDNKGRSVDMNHVTWVVFVFMRCNSGLVPFRGKVASSGKNQRQVSGGPRHQELWYTSIHRLLSNISNHSLKPSNNKGRSPDTSVGTVTSLRAARPQFDSRQEQGFLPPCHRCVQISFGAHPASYPVGTGDSFPEDKSAGAWSRPHTSI
jgi:hypothetical protein